MLTAEKAKEKISVELVGKFREYIADWDSLPDFEFGKKYGWGRGEIRPAYTFKSLNTFMNDIFGGRWLQDWEREGYPAEIIRELHHDRWLSLSEYSNFRARATGMTDFYYINQKTAREIWRQYK